MPGWRVGAALGNAELLHMLFVMKTHADSGHFLPILQAATQALDGDQSWLAGRNEIYRRRRDRLAAVLRGLNVEFQVPKASIYVWASVPDGITSEVFTTRLLEQAHVSLAPGTIFGSGGENYVRIALTTPDERFDEALERLKLNWYR
jgi:LL-diaminopimelate aminotransferase